MPWTPSQIRGLHAWLHGMYMSSRDPDESQMRGMYPKCSNTYWRARYDEAYKARANPSPAYLPPFELPKRPTPSRSAPSRKRGKNESSDESSDTDDNEFIATEDSSSDTSIDLTQTNDEAEDDDDEEDGDGFIVPDDSSEDAEATESSTADTPWWCMFCGKFRSKAAFGGKHEYGQCLEHADAPLFMLKIIEPPPTDDDIKFVNPLRHATYVTRDLYCIGCQAFVNMDSYNGATGWKKRVCTAHSNAGDRGRREETTEVWCRGCWHNRPNTDFTRMDLDMTHRHWRYCKMCKENGKDV